MRKLNSHDIFVASRLLGKIGYKKVIQEIVNETKKFDNLPENATKEEIEQRQQDLGMVVISILLEAISKDEKFEDAFFEFISSPLETGIEELKAMHPTKLINLVIEFVKQEDKETWLSFWKSLVGLMH